MDKNPIDFAHPERVAHALYLTTLRLLEYNRWLIDTLKDLAGGDDAFYQIRNGKFTAIDTLAERDLRTYTDMVPLQQDGETGTQYGKRLWSLFHPTITTWEEINHESLQLRISQYLQWVVVFKDNNMSWHRSNTNQFINDTLAAFKREGDAWIKETQDLQRSEQELFAYLSEHWKRCERSQTGDWVLNVLQHCVIERPEFKHPKLPKSFRSTGDNTARIFTARTCMIAEDGTAHYVGSIREGADGDERLAWVSEAALNTHWEELRQKPKPIPMMTDVEQGAQPPKKNHAAVAFAHYPATVQELIKKLHHRVSLLPPDDVYKLGEQVVAALNDVLQWRYDTGDTFHYKNKLDVQMRINARMLDDNLNLYYSVIDEKTGNIGQLAESTLDKRYARIKPSPHAGRWHYTTGATFVPKPETGRSERQLNVLQRVLNEQDEACYMMYDPFSRERRTHILTQAELIRDFFMGEKAIGGKR